MIDIIRQTIEILLLLISQFNFNQPTVEAQSYPNLQLTEIQIEAILTESGWPLELLWEAKSVAKGESNWRPTAIGDGGNSLGLFQLWTGWFGYCKEEIAHWMNPLVNSRVAWCVYNYDINRGQEPWSQWTIKPHR